MGNKHTGQHRQVSADSRLILVAEPFVDVLIHERSLPDTIAWM